MKRSCGYGLCLLASVAMNIWFSVNLYYGDGKGGSEIGARYKWEKQGEYNLTWTRAAAAEAEAVAAVDCSGHGRAYLDGSPSNNLPLCECNTCYLGPDCSQLLPDCAADADSGDPIFLEPFWMERAADSAILVSGWNRMSYRYGDNTQQSKELEKYIRQVHSIAGNAITDGKNIVFGVGSSQLINAAVYALSDNDNSSSPSSVVASIPFYPIYEIQTELFNAVEFKFEGDTEMWKNTSGRNNGTNVIEFVTSPNNPDGLLKKPVVGGLDVKVIHDHAYYWPHFSSIPAPSDQDLMIFTLSKLAGHAGTRFGWALVKDTDVYNRMMSYIRIADLGISHDSQLRALKLLKVITEGDGKEIFKFAYKKMRERWVRLSRAFSMSKRFSIQDIPPRYCSFFKMVRGPSPAYAWVKCEREEENDCSTVLRAGNIRGRRGSMFKAEDRYVRLSLIKSQDDFEQLLQRVSDLVAQEGGAERI